MKARVLHSREGQYLNVLGDNQYIKQARRPGAPIRSSRRSTLRVSASLCMFTRTRMRHSTSWKGRWNSRWTESA